MQKTRQNRPKTARVRDSTLMRRRNSVREFVIPIQYSPIKSFGMNYLHANCNDENNLAETASSKSLKSGRLRPKAGGGHPLEKYAEPGSPSQILDAGSRILRNWKCTSRRNRGPKCETPPPRGHIRFRHLIVPLLYLIYSAKVRFRWVSPRWPLRCNYTKAPRTDS